MSHVRKIELFTFKYSYKQHYAEIFPPADYLPKKNTFIITIYVAFFLELVEICSWRTRANL
jgi:hypothetical protein